MKAGFLVLPLLFVVASSAQAAERDPVKDFVTAYIAKNRIPGVALMVRRQGRVVRAEGYGMANLEHRVPVKPETVFQSGSMGKQFTAMAVMTLVDEGKLALDDPVSKYLDAPAEWKGITVRHLLTHTSGLGDYPEDFPMQKDATEDEELKMAMAQKLLFAPGEKWSYSNLGYLTLGVLIHKVSGKFYGDLLAERVFRPLGMTRTRIISESDIVPDRAAGYRIVDDEIKNQEWVAPSLNTTADGSLYFTVLDLAKWDEALEAGKIVSRSSYDAMWSPVRLNDGSSEPYGFGWGIHRAANGHRLIDHSGSWQGFQTYIGRYPDDRLTVAVLCNMAGATPSYIARRVAGMYDAALVPPPRKGVKLDAAKVKRFAGVYRLEEDRLAIGVLGPAGRLQAKTQGLLRDLMPESETDFFEEDSDRTYHFVVQDGAVTGVEVAVPETIVFRKVE
ncbi:MAG TPA: serine hydrolase domain-containing protein [Candidatus Polarisedimenticolia bacterium]|jgi:CubicO group peptidase (beta-lactamase class C family)|nr:serine hydrolase domain-containing protein [Candidatus Polarisedimenticolia bacterium]